MENLELFLLERVSAKRAAQVKQNKGQKTPTNTQQQTQTSTFKPYFEVIFKHKPEGSKVDRYEVFNLYYEQNPNEKKGVPLDQELYDNYLKYIKKIEKNKAFFAYANIINENPSHVTYYESLVSNKIKDAVSIKDFEVVKQQNKPNRIRIISDLPHDIEDIDTFISKTLNISSIYTKKSAYKFDPMYTGYYIFLFNKFKEYTVLDQFSIDLLAIVPHQDATKEKQHIKKANETEEQFRRSLEIIDKTLKEIIKKIKSGLVSGYIQRREKGRIINDNKANKLSKKYFNGMLEYKKDVVKNYKFVPWDQFRTAEDKYFKEVFTNIANLLFPETMKLIGGLTKMGGLIFKGIKANILNKRINKDND